MATNYPHQITPHAVVACVDREDDGLGARVMGRVRQLFCGLHGHDNMMQFEHDRMFLRCVSCGHESPGWELTEPSPVPAREEAATRPALTQTQLIGARRIA